MPFMNVAIIIVAVLSLGYLIYAMLRPERF
ncbi:MAG: K(+)-transporting ATPase subunit F [Phycisphaerales bacterium]|nr:K(+)-transporting ATPase subunit F [Phycisphaerales bacterium]